LRNSLLPFKVSPLHVIFRRTGRRRYAVVVSVPGDALQAVDPAPGYDDDIPHDLVHYIVEAELRLQAGVFGRVAQGGGTFIPSAEQPGDSRERMRRQRKQRRRELSLRARDEARTGDMVASERLSAICDVAWRRRHGQRADPLRQAPEMLANDADCVERVVARLDRLAPLWRELPVGGEIVFEWPSATPREVRGAVRPDQAAMTGSRAVDK
jgi:hypothetical protein